jgi:hypothetical protein
MKEKDIPMIAFKDNFLSKKYLTTLQDLATNLPMEPSFNGKGKGIGSRLSFNLNDEIFNELRLKIKEDFPLSKKFNIDNEATFFHLRHSILEPLPHVDDGKHKYNFLFFLKGEELLNNGTGFYHNQKLSAHVGFIENRAIFFDGNKIWHTNLQHFGKSSPRYTILIFFK